MKKKTAKEMFKELGYSVLIDNEYQICYDNAKEKKGVIFAYEDLKIVLRDPNREISVPLLRAINKQCEELEWFDMSTGANDISFDVHYMSDKIQSLIDETSRLDVENVDLKIRVNQLESVVIRLTAKVYEDSN